MDAWMDAWMDGCMDGWMDGCMHGQTLKLLDHTVTDIPYLRL